MTTQMITGKRGEILGACWLSVNGYQIMFKNWRYGHGEIDIIARKNGVIHFIEVKTCLDTYFGYPEERVNRRKRNSMMRSAEAFMTGSPFELQIQFDVMSILIQKSEVQYHFIEDAFSFFKESNE